jgi:hypothetical protein
MALEFAVYERTQTATAISLGTVSEIAGAKAELSFIPSNLANADKRVMVVINKADGTSATVVCSKPVSDGIRSKEITIGNLKGFEVREHVATTGEVYNQIDMPISNLGMIKFNLDDIQTAEYKVKGLTEQSIKNLLAVSL